MINKIDTKAIPFITEEHLYKTIEIPLNFNDFLEKLIGKVKIEKLVFTVKENKPVIEIKGQIAIEDLWDSSYILREMISKKNTCYGNGLLTPRDRQIIKIKKGGKFEEFILIFKKDKDGKNYIEIPFVFFSRKSLYKRLFDE